MQPLTGRLHADTPDEGLEGAPHPAGAIGAMAPARMALTAPWGRRTEPWVETARRNGERP